MTYHTRALVALLVVPAAVGARSSRASSGRSAPAAALASPAIDAPLASAAAAPLDTAIFAGGCFWGVEAVFEHLKGVKSAESGYAGGKVASPTYEQISTGDTGHAESVRVVYDPSQISYGQLLQVFFSVAHDPTQLNRQGPDRGTQYRSAIFYRTPEQKRIVSAYVAQLGASKSFSRPIVTEIAPLRTFYVAESYHQDYLVNHPNQPYIVIHDKPKVEALKRQFSALYRE
jgi:peptide-methionine (S)-S-oxide reductase